MICPLISVVADTHRRVEKNVLGSRNDSTEGKLVNSLVGEGTHFRGDLELSGLLRIDGDYSGSIRTSGKVILGHAGRADCSIEASVVVIGGILRGEVFCTSKLIVLSSAIVIGDLHAPRMVAEEGTMIHGRCIVTGMEEFERRLRRLKGSGSPVRQGVFRPAESFAMGGEDDPFASVEYSAEDRVPSATEFDPDRHE